MRNAYTEFQIEDFIWSKINDLDYLADRGLVLQNGLYFRQYNIPGCGIVDIIGFSVTNLEFNDGSVVRELTIHVYELKRDAIKCADIGQISRYIDCLRYNSDAILKHFGLEGYELVVRGLMIGNGVDRDAMHAKSLVEFLETIYCYEFSPESGVRFNPISAINTHSKKNRVISVSGMTKISLKEIEDRNGVDRFHQSWFTHKKNEVDFSNN